MACLLDTEENMPFTTGLIFVEKTATEMKRNITLGLLKEVHKAFERGVDNVAWLDDASRAVVRLKAKYMVNIVADLDREKKAIEHRYAQISPPSNPENFSDFLIACQRNLVRENLRLLNKPNERKGWLTSSYNLPVHIPNAFYSPVQNRMVILAGIMRKPFLYENGQSLLNFARLGMIIGHEMIHGFDSQGWYYDMYGNIAPWWTEKASQAFSRHAKCLVDQYSKFPYGYDNERHILHVNGQRTLGENIADNGGLKYSYQAYKHWISNNLSEEKLSIPSFSMDQLFFLCYAQACCQAVHDNYKPRMLENRHSPHKFRVIGSLINFKEFGKVFNCPVGSRMNPHKRCEFWQSLET